MDFACDCAWSFTSSRKSLPRAVDHGAVPAVSAVDISLSVIKASVVDGSRGNPSDILARDINSAVAYREGPSSSLECTYPLYVDPVGAGAAGLNFRKSGDLGRSVVPQLSTPV